MNIEKAECAYVAARMRMESAQAKEEKAKGRAIIAFGSYLVAKQKAPSRALVRATLQAYEDAEELGRTFEDAEDKIRKDKVTRELWCVYQEALRTAESAYLAAKEVRECGR